MFTNEGDLIIHLLVFQVDDDPTSGEEGNVVRDTWNFQFDFQAPDAPPLERVTPGERSVDVQWDSPGATDIQFYQVDYCPNVTLETVQRLTTATLDPNLVNNTSGAEAFELLMMPCDDTSGLESRSSIRETEDNITISDGIEEGTWVAFSLFAQDESPFLNLTTESPVYAVRTEVATDFWERQRELGGGEDGGFCFVATAAHGSYAHPVVGLLRGLRDQVLGRLPFGRALTRAYYTVSPPLASAIDGRPALAEAARWGLLGFVLGLLGLALSVAGVLAAWISSAARRWARAGALVGVIAASFPGSASAQVRGDATGIVGVGLEFKAGPYLPEIAKDLEDGGLPAFEEIHGAGRTRVLVNVGGEIQFLRGNFGTLSLGGTVGFIAWEGKALVEDAGGFLRPAANGSTTFNIVPMTLTLGYRFDLLMDRTPVPLAPYVRAGLAYHIFWNTRDDGSLSRFTVDGEEREALGARPGFVGTLGISLALNAIDPNGAARFRGTTGIRTSYLFFEGQLSQVDGFGDDSNFDFSDLTWFAGLMLEI
ncbi:MAG: MXAN_2562 family outer membrane beta-barrel protein [Myxococcota bacterium]